MIYNKRNVEKFSWVPRQLNNNSILNEILIEYFKYLNVNYNYVLQFSSVTF